MTMPTVIETKRLIIREFLLDDAEFVLQLLNTEGWLKYIGDKNIHTVEESRTYLQNRLLQIYAEFGYGLWLVELKETCLPIGMCGLIKREALEHTDIGFAFLPAYEAKGYAFEAAKASLAYAFEELHLPEILAIVQENNARSIKLLERLGLQYKHNVLINQEYLCLFGISANAHLNL